MTPERYEQELLLAILRKRGLIVDYQLSEDGKKLAIKPVKPADWIVLYLGNDEIERKEFSENLNKVEQI